MVMVVTPPVLPMVVISDLVVLVVMVVMVMKTVVVAGATQSEEVEATEAASMVSLPTAAVPTAEGVAMVAGKERETTRAVPSPVVVAEDMMEDEGFSEEEVAATDMTLSTDSGVELGLP